MLVNTTLNEFVKRILNTESLKVVIKSSGAMLSRKGRSRNRLLQTDDEQIWHIINVITQSGENSWCWLTKKLIPFRCTNGIG